MAELLPLFPLHTVLFPDMLLPLHVFEPRYRLLVRRSVERETAFGVALIRRGPEVGGVAEPHPVGTSARIVAATRLADGRAFVVVRGERRFTIESLDAGAEPYLVGRVRWLEELDGDEAAPLAEASREAYGQYLVAVTAVTDEARAGHLVAEQRGDATPRDIAYRIAARLTVDPEERQRLLDLPSAAERLGAEARILERETALLRDLAVRMRARGERHELH